MPFRHVDELADALIRLRLISPEHLHDCLTALGGQASRPEALLQALESRGELTAYQVGRLRKGETDGLVLGDYKLMYQNASGSFARVWRACSVVDGEMVGLKVLRQRWAKDPKVVAQFRREAELCKKLRHKNIVPIYDVLSDNGYHFFTMEFVEGGNLRDFLAIRKKLSPVEAARCALDIADGLAYATSRGVTHRDLKLTNVLMSTSGVARLVDFGLAGDDADNEDNERALEYATLERGTNAPRDDPRSDLYFLGAILYELLTGIPPYPRTASREERKQLARYTHVRPVRELDPSLPRCVSEIVDRLMKPNPHHRYQTPVEVAADLRRALAELGDSPAAAGDASQTGGSAADANQPTVMFIEDRIKHQDVLRDYMTRHGFRVLMLTDIRRAVQRLRNGPPDCVVFMGDSLGSEILDVYRESARLGAAKSFATIAVLSEKQAAHSQGLPQSDSARVLVQPVRIRELRREIKRALRALGRIPTTVKDATADQP